MGRPDDTLYPAEPPPETADLAASLERLELRPIKGPLDHRRLVHDGFEKWQFQLLLGLFEREATKLGLGEVWRTKRELAISVARDYLEREPLELPLELSGGITRNEARKFREIWEAITDCLQCPLALTRAKDNRTKAVAFTLNPVKYDEVIDYCSRMLSKNLRPLMRRNYKIPPLPMFGRKGVSEGDVEVYKFHDFEILETCFRRDIELFVLYLTRFQQLVEEEEAVHQPLHLWIPPNH